MPRVKRGPKRKNRRAKTLALAKGYYGTKSKSYRMAKLAVEKSLVYAYRDRKVKKRDFRGLWIIRINAAARLNGVTYGHFIAALKDAKIDLDRKILADIAIRDAATFSQIATHARILPWISSSCSVVGATCIRNRL